MLSPGRNGHISRFPRHGWRGTSRFVWTIVLPFVLSCGGGSTEPAASNAVASVTIAPSTLVISEIQTSQLAAATKTSNGTTLSGHAIAWSSSSPAVATVSSTGLVTGISPGTTVITATSEGVSGTVATTVTVSPCNSTVAVPIVAGQTINGTLSNSDCPVGDGTYLDGYKFVITAPTTVDILLKSAAFDAYLFLFVESTASNGLTRVAENDNANDGTNAELTGLLSAGTYYILANSINVGGFGPYTLTFISPAVPTLKINSSAPMLRAAPMSKPVTSEEMFATHSNAGVLFRGLVRR